MDLTSTGTLEVRASDGELISPAQGSAFKMDNGLVAVFMSQEEYDRHVATGVPSAAGVQVVDGAVRIGTSDGA